MIVFLIGLAMTIGQSSDTAADLGAYAQVRTELQRCHIASEPSRFSYEDELQSYELVQGGADVTEESVRCLAGSTILDGLVLTFEDLSLHAPYYVALGERPEIKEAMSQLRDSQREWLESRSLLAGMPTLISGEPLSAYTARVETHCGVLPGSIVEADDDREVTFLHSSSVSFDQYVCVHNVLDVSSPGLKIYMLGYEAEAKP